MTVPPPCIPFDELALPDQRFDGYIFDCDGTLADTMPLHHRAWLHALAEAGARFEFDWDLFVSRAGMSLERTVIELNQQFGERLDPIRISRAQRAYFEASLMGIAPIPSVVNFALSAARDRAVSVASGSERRHVKRTLELIGVLPYFEVIVTPADVEHGKPAPDMFLMAAERMRVAPERCLVVEDSELGILAAQRAGMHSALVCTQRPASAAPSAGPES